MTRANAAAVPIPMTRPDRVEDSPLLTHDEERQYSQAARSGDRAARDRLVIANLRLVYKIARGFLGRGLTLEDLVGEGNLGLLRAAVEYDPDFGTRFSTYASYWIKEAIRHALVNTTATIRLPAHLVTILTKWRRAEGALARELERSPTADEVAARLGLTDGQRALVAQARKVMKVGSDGGGQPCSDASANPYAAGSGLEAEERRQELARRLGRLGLRERAVVEKRFGLNGERPATLVEVGRVIGSTRESARKLEVRALRKMGDVPGDAEVSEREWELARAVWRGTSDPVPGWAQVTEVARAPGSGRRSIEVRVAAQ